MTISATTLESIDAAMTRIKTRIEHSLPGAKVSASRNSRLGTVTKLVVRVGAVQIKIEVTPVLRGCVFEPVTASVPAGVEDVFGFAWMMAGERKVDLNCTAPPGSE